MNKCVARILCTSMLCILGLSTSCEKESDNGKEQGENDVLSLNGCVQKGQFARGSQITVFGLNNKLEATGESWPSNIIDATGSFSVGIQGNSAYLEMRASGYYFNEVLGDMSDGSITLEALTASNAKQVNVNILTHLVRPRIKKLISEGATFDKARSQAESELVKALGFSSLNISFDQLDITKSREGDALLLALACAIQQEHTTGQVVKLLNEMALNFESEASFTENQKNTISEGFAKVDVYSVYENLKSYYTSNSISNARVPDFYKYILAKDLFEISATEVTFPYLGGESTLKVVSMQDFVLESTAEWLTVTKEHIWGPYYNIVLRSKANETTERFEDVLLIKNVQGAELQRVLINADTYVYTLTCQTDYLINSEFCYAEGSIVTVNGHDYPLYNVGSERGIITFQIDVRDLNLPESFVIKYPKELVEEQIDGTFHVKIPSEQYTDAQDIFACLGKKDNSWGLLNRLCALVSVDVNNYPEWNRIEVRSLNDHPLCGDMVISADYEINAIKNGRSVIRIYKQENSSHKIYFPVIPGAIKLEIEVFDSNNQSIYFEAFPKEVTLELGTYGNAGKLR